MSYQHGIYGSEVATSLLAPTPTDAGLVVAFGTAPVHLAKNPAPANKPVLCYQLSEFVEQFGNSADFDKYTLCEAAKSQFVLFKVAPTVFVNVLDPKKHFSEVTEDWEEVEQDEIITFEGDNVILDTVKVTSSGEEILTLTENTDYEVVTNTGTGVTEINILAGTVLPSNDITIEYTKTDSSVVSSTVAISSLPFILPTGATNLSITATNTFTNDLIRDTDFTVEYNSDGQAVFTVLDDSKIVDGKIKIFFHNLDPSLVTSEDIIGGVDLVTGDNTGLEVIEDIFPHFRLVPGMIIAPKFSTDPLVAAVMKAKCTNINSCFRAIALCDIPTDEVINYTNAPAYKNKKNLVDTSLVVCYPKVALDGEQYHLSTQLASLINQTDAAYDDIPYKSPSNENLQCDSSVLADGSEKFLSLTQANYLNGQGIGTALNFSGGWKFWSNRTSAYPSNTDVKDNFLPIRRMFNWINNILITDFWSQVDSASNRRLIDTVIDSANIWLNGLTAKGALLGGRVEFLGTENPTTDLMDGIIKSHVFFTPPSPAREIHFILEYDPSYIANLTA